jgi:hypothetical protein
MVDRDRHLGSRWLLEPRNCQARQIATRMEKRAGETKAGLRPEPSEVLFSPLRHENVTDGASTVGFSFLWQVLCRRR